MKTATATASYKPAAAVSDRSCLRAGCHDAAALGVVKGRRFAFDHQMHLGGENAGIVLACTSCHSKVGMQTHFTVDEQACFACHLATEEVATRSCVACHGIPSKKTPTLGLDHRLLVSKADDSRCIQCHAVESRDRLPVDATRCASCHLEDPSRLRSRDAGALHRVHVVERSIKCSRCHVEVPHGKREHPGVLASRCADCHGRRHSEPEMLYAGVSGFGLTASPSPMHSAGVECTGCQAHGTAGSVDLAEARSSCSLCHAPRYALLVDEWKRGLEAGLLAVGQLDRELASRLPIASPAERAGMLSALEESRRKVALVRAGNGVHNYDYAMRILNDARSALERALPPPASRQTAALLVEH